MPTTNTVLPPRLTSAVKTLYAVQGDVYALDPGNGKLLRHYPIDGFCKELAVADGVLYVTLDNHIVQALRAPDGDLLWQYVAESDLVGTPFIADGVVYVGAGNGTDKGSLCALRAIDGTLLWKYTIESEIEADGEPMPTASPLVANSVVYVPTYSYASLSAYVYALDASTGALFWQAELPEPTFAVLTFLGETLYLTTHKRCCALQASDGSLLWSWTPKKPGTYSLPIVTREALYVSSLQLAHEFSFEEQKLRTGKKSQLYALDLSNGAPLWNIQVTTEENTDSGFVTDPTVSLTSIFIGTDDGRLSAFYRNDATLHWQYQTHGSMLSTPIIVDDTVSVGVNDGSVVALHVSNGSLVWQTPLKGKKRIIAHSSLKTVS